MTNRRARGAIITAAVILASLAAAPGADATNAKSYAKTMNGPTWMGAHVRGTHHQKYIMVAHRDPVHPVPSQYDEDDPHWNCFVDGNGSCGGDLARARGFITKTQNRKYEQRFGIDDVCLYASDDPWGAIWCADGRTYATYDLVYRTV